MLCLFPSCALCKDHKDDDAKILFPVLGIILLTIFLIFLSLILGSYSSIDESVLKLKSNTGTDQEKMQVLLLLINRSRK